MVSVELCKAIQKAKQCPVEFEPGGLYYEKTTGLKYVCQDVFKSGPCMVRIGFGGGKGSIMNPAWFVPALTVHDVSDMVKYHNVQQTVIEVNGTLISFRSPSDTIFIVTAKKDTDAKSNL